MVQCSCADLGSISHKIFLPFRPVVELFCTFLYCKSWASANANVAEQKVFKKLTRGLQDSIKKMVSFQNLSFDQYDHVEVSEKNLYHMGRTRKIKPGEKDL